MTDRPKTPPPGQRPCWKCKDGWLLVAHMGDVAWDECHVCDATGFYTPELPPDELDPPAEPAIAEPIVATLPTYAAAVEALLQASNAAYAASLAYAALDLTVPSAPAPQDADFAALQAREAAALQARILGSYLGGAK